MVGVNGTLVLESMRMITIVSGKRKVVLTKTGTVLQIKDSGKVVMATR